MDNLSSIYVEVIETEYASCVYYRIGKVGFVYTSLKGTTMNNGIVIATHPSWFRPLQVNNIVAYHSPLAYSNNVIRVDYAVVRFFHANTFESIYVGYSFHSMILE